MRGKNEEKKKKMMKIKKNQEKTQKMRKVKKQLGKTEEILVKMGKFW